MEAPPGHVIRVLRQALKMSQGEFARALGWVPSTISRWERGQAPPSRLALKTILAFAEERGVRYKPKAQPTATALVPFQEREMPPSLRREGESDLLPPPPSPETSGSRSSGGRFLSITAERPRWSAEANFRLSADRRPAGPPQRSRTALHSAGIVAATLCAVLTIGLRGSVQHTTPLDGTTPNPTTHPLRTLSSMPPAPKPAAQRLASAPLAKAAAPYAIVPDSVADATTEAPAPAPIPAPLARLESIVMIGDTHRATFRTKTDSVTVTEGSWLGGRQVGRIDTDHVELVGGAGKTRTVRVGSPTLLE